MQYNLCHLTYIFYYFRMRFPDCLQKTYSNGDKIGVWCREVDDNHFFCKYCDRKLVCTRGVMAIKDHAKAKIHISNKLKYHDKKQLRLTSFTRDKAPITTKDSTMNKNQNTSSMVLVLKDDSMIIKELMYVIHLVNENRSAASADREWKILQLLAPNDLHNFKISDTKVSRYINYVLAPHFIKLILNDQLFKYFSISYDETENKKNEKELQFSITYCSKRQQKVVSLHLETFFIGQATSIILFEKFKMCMDDNNLSLTNLVCVGSDGPNVNLSTNRMINNEVINARKYPLLKTGTCLIHFLHLNFWAFFSADKGHPAYAAFRNADEARPKRRFMEAIVNADAGAL